MDTIIVIMFNTTTAGPTKPGMKLISTPSVDISDGSLPHTEANTSNFSMTNSPLGIAASERLPKRKTH
jgi:hypothetical protein